ncbi:MAG: MFS transporter, partial [Alphaproteobacteria bacterium]
MSTYADQLKKDLDALPASIRGIYPWLVWSCAGAFFFFQFIIRVSPNVMANDLMRELEIHACSLGTLSSFYYWGYTGMQIPVGLMLDSLGVKRPLAMAAFICGLGCMLFSMTSDMMIMSAGRFMMGVGSAFGFLSCIKAGTTWFIPQRLGLIIGLSMLAGTVGATSGYAPLAILIDLTDWRTTVMILGCICILISMGALFVIRDRKSDSDDQGQEKASVFDGLITILKNPNTYLFGLYGSLMYLPLAAFADLWGTPFLLQAYDVTPLEAAGSISMIYLGIGAGGPITAFLAEYFQSYKRLMVKGAALTLIMYSFIIYYPHLPFIFTYGLFFLTGILSSVQFFAFACVCELNPRCASATASGMHNMMCMISGILFQPIVGKLLELWWDGTVVAGAPSYSTDNYFNALAVIPASVLLAVIIGFAL